MTRRSLPLIAVMLATLAAIGLAALVAWNQLSGTSGATARGPGEAVVAPGLAVGGSFHLTDHTGKPVTEADFAGQYMLIYFGYTACPDVCPTELSSIAAGIDILAEESPELAAQVVPVFITIDPARDTQAVMADYAAAFHPRMVGLTGTQAEIDEAAKKYRVYFAKGEVVSEDFYLMNHSSYIYFMGPQGEFITMFKGGVAPDVMAEAMGRYMSAPSG